MIRFFVFSDLHHGEVESDGRRVAELTARAREQKPDFIISLGDLCPPMEENRWILRELESVACRCTTRLETTILTGIR